MAIARTGNTDCRHAPGCPHDIGPAAARVTTFANAIAAAEALADGQPAAGSGPVERSFTTPHRPEQRAQETPMAETGTDAQASRMRGNAAMLESRRRKASDDQIVAALRRHRGNRNAAATELGMTVTPMTKHCERIAAAGRMPGDVAEMIASRAFGRKPSGPRPVLGDPLAGRAERLASDEAVVASGKPEPSGGPLEEIAPGFAPPAFLAQLEDTDTLVDSAGQQPPWRREPAPNVVPLLASEAVAVAARWPSGPDALVDGYRRVRDASLLLRGIGDGSLALACEGVRRELADAIADREAGPA